MQPQVIIKDYSSKSVVLRAVPEDYFKPYSQKLTEVGGKWNPYLKEPQGSQNVLGGWIFQKTKENEVKQLVNQILSGQVAQAPPKYSPLPSSAPTIMNGSPQPAIFGSLQHAGLVRAGVPPAVRPGYQQIELIKPEVGGTLYLELGGSKHPIKVESVQEEQGIVVSATILLPDGQRTQISIQKPQWKIVGLPNEHSIIL